MGPFWWIICLWSVPVLSKPFPEAQPDPDVLTLTSVVVMYRHGDRTPIDPYPNDPYKDPNLWPVGFGQLTNIGKMMHYQLGKYLRQRYINFLNETYSEKEIYIRSTDIDRTLMSAYSNLAGLYPPKQNQIWNPNLAWQPIPVHTVPEEEDSLLSSHATCPRQQYLIDHLKDLPEIQEIDKKYKWMYEYISNNTGAEVNNMVQVDYIFDTLYIQSLYNFTLPDWTKKVFPKPMQELKDLSFKTTTWTQEMKRLRAGPLIKDILEHFTVTANASDIRPKFLMYSGHDTSISSVLNALEMFDPPISPPYASMVIAELFFRDIDEKYFVRFSYRNDTTRDPYVLSVMAKCGEYCPLEEFDELTKDIRPGNWKDECRMGPNDDPTITLVTEFSIAVTGLLFIVLITSVVLSFCIKREWRQKEAHPYQSINQDIR